MISPFGEPPCQNNGCRLLSTSITLMVSAIIASVLLVVFALFFVQMSREGKISSRKPSPSPIRWRSPAPWSTACSSVTSGAIQRFAEQVRHQNELLFVVVVDMQGIRYSHPKPWLIGKHFIGDDLAPALQGHVNSAINRGTLAPALRVFVPVYDAQKQQRRGGARHRAGHRVTGGGGEPLDHLLDHRLRRLVGSLAPLPSPRSSASCWVSSLRKFQPVRTAQRHAAVD
ncbi:hypothetical protein M8494_14410 [Serratia ureilytica]